MRRVRERGEGVPASRRLGEKEVDAFQQAGAWARTSHRPYYGRASPAAPSLSMVGAMCPRQVIGHCYW